MKDCATWPSEPRNVKQQVVTRRSQLATVEPILGYQARLSAKPPIEKRETETMEFIDPRGVSQRPIEPYEVTAALSPGDTVALFANGFPDSGAFLEHLEKVLTPELPGVEFLHLNKGNASALASEEHLSTIAESCSAVVAAYGH